MKPTSPSAWPPGPRTAFTGWSLLRRMSRDLLGTAAQWAAQYGKLVHLRIWPEHQIIVSDPELARELLVKHHDSLIRWERGIQVFSQLQGHSVLIAEGAAWKHKRQALHPNFTPKSVQALVPTLTAAVHDTLNAWPVSHSAFPIESAITSLTMEAIVRMMFSSRMGEDARVAEQAIHTLNRVANAELYWPASWPDWAPWKRSKRQALRALNTLIERHIQTRCAMPQALWPSDLLSSMLSLHLENPQDWPLQAVRDECMTTFMAGHETTAATLTWWLWCMASNRHIQSRAREEVQAQLGPRKPEAADLPALVYLGQTLQETLRLYPTAPVLLTRRSTAAITLGGYTLPAKTLFTVPVQLMHHDPHSFPEPLRFQPERFAKDAPAIPRGAYLPFGTGPRVCLGQHLAFNEMLVIAALLLTRYQLTPAPHAQPPRPEFHISLRPHQPLSLGIHALNSPS